MEYSLQQAYEHCRRVTRKRAKNFYYAFVALPRPKRLGIYAAYAFCRQCDDYSDEDAALEKKTRLLEEYRKQLHQAFRGEPNGPVFIALMDAVRKYDIPLEYLEDVISGVEMDLTTTRYDTFEELRQYCYRVASVVGLICIQIFGYRDERARDYAIDMGIAMQLTNILRDIEEDCGRDRIYLPLDELDRFRCSEEDLTGGIASGDFVEMMTFQVARAREYFVRSRALLPLLDARSRLCPAVLQGLYIRLLDRIEARGYDVFNCRVRLTTGEKVGLTGKIWLKTLSESLLDPRSWS